MASMRWVAPSSFVLVFLVLAPGFAAAENENRSGHGAQYGFRGYDACLTAGTASVTIDRAYGQVRFDYRPLGPANNPLAGAPCGYHAYAFLLATMCAEDGAALHCLSGSYSRAELTVNAEGTLYYSWYNCYYDCEQMDVNGLVRNA